MRLILIGFKGSGKTTAGRLLAKDLACTFMDTDEALCQSYGASTIRAIYQKVGDAQFRQLEFQLLNSMRKPSSMVLATGGGVIENPSTVNILKHLGTMIFLDTSLQQIKKRLSDYQHLPLFQHQTIDSLYQYRLGLYLKHAQYIVKTDDKTPQQIVDEIKQSLGYSNGQ